MTSEDIRGELDRQPFIPLRLHLVSGATFDVGRADEAWMLQNAVLMLQVHSDGGELYNIISLRNIERLERLGG
jgi:hypothetical protein